MAAATLSAGAQRLRAIIVQRRASAARQLCDARRDARAGSQSAAFFLQQFKHTTRQIGYLYPNPNRAEQLRQHATDMHTGHLYEELARAATH